MAHTLTSQPANNSISAAYRPILLSFSVDVSVDDCPAAFCDVYIGWNFYKTIQKTQPTSTPTGFQVYRFDIMDAVQEYFTKHLAASGGHEMVDVAALFATVFCRFRNTTVDADGFIVSNGTVPVQATASTASVPGTGLPSNIFYVVNSTLQHEHNQDLVSHLNAYKTGTWNSAVYPLTHRPAGKIFRNDSDYFPILNFQDTDPECIKLHYKLKSVSSYATQTYCVPGPPAPCIPVTLRGSSAIPNGMESVLYYGVINFDGTLPISITGTPVKPSWMTLTVFGDSILLEGTPTTADIGTNIQVSFTVANECGTVDIDEQINILPIGDCVIVSIPFTAFPNGTVGVGYYFAYSILGTPSFTLSMVIKPDWLSVTVIGNQIIFEGIPDTAETIDVQFKIANCGGFVMFSQDLAIDAAPTCNGYLNNTGASLGPIAYTHCGGDAITGVTMAQGDTICARTGTVTGTGAGLLTDTGTCALECLRYAIKNDSGDTRAITYQLCSGEMDTMNVVDGSITTVCSLSVPIADAPGTTIYATGGDC